jgi:hypothetical protein
MKKQLEIKINQSDEKESIIKIKPYIITETTNYIKARQYMKEIDESVFQRQTNNKN